VDKVPPLVQALAVIAGAIGAAIAWVVGLKSRNGSSDSNDNGNRQKYEQERADRLALQKQIDDERLRSDFQQALGALREAVFNKLSDQEDGFRSLIQSMQHDISQIKTDIEVMKARRR
jgi:hypothetical protein